MTQTTRILIAYDGSAPADAALGDMCLAGLPRSADALVVSVAEQWLPSPASYGMIERRFIDTSSMGIEVAQMLAARACDRLQSSFPDWHIRGEAGSGSPARILIAKAADWRADLVVLGSHGQSILERFVLGSVSQRVLTATASSVRIGRKAVAEDDSIVRIVIGMDCSPGAEAAVRAVSARQWPPGSEVHLVSAQFAIPPPAADRMIGAIAEWVAQEREKVRHAHEASRKLLCAARLRVSSVIKGGDPKWLICEEARKYGAHSIFVGARGLSRFDRFMLGSVSAAVAARAHCSVEVVRAVPED
jgi:nucleotide-binding universal stress UspA family protein